MLLKGWIVLFLTSLHQGFISCQSVETDRCMPQLSPCVKCQEPISVTLKAQNVLQGDNFLIEANIVQHPMQPLLFFLEKAASISDGFNRFTSTYYKNLGYFINSINGIEGSIPNKTFWHISSGGLALKCGASSYIPKNGETILFNFTTYRDAGFE